MTEWGGCASNRGDNFTRQTNAAAAILPITAVGNGWGTVKLIHHYATTTALGMETRRLRYLGVRSGKLCAWKLTAPTYIGQMDAIHTQVITKPDRGHSMLSNKINHRMKWSDNPLAIWWFAKNLLSHSYPLFEVPKCRIFIILDVASNRLKRSTSSSDDGTSDDAVATGKLYIRLSGNLNI